MPRTKERKKHIHEPSTHEVFLCLSSMLAWSQILLEKGVVKEYQSFLKGLIETRYFEDREEKVTIKQIAASFKHQTTKVTKWLHEIYNDILELNNDKEELFTNNKLPITCYFSYFDSSGSVTLGMDAVPRVYEEFNMYFMKAKVGCERFWVNRVEHEVHDTGAKIFLWLEGGILNRYREMAVEEALFKGWIGFMDQWQLTNSEMDDIIIKHHRR
ncbi:MAG: hypothetical protein IPP11_09245 [Chitinophagaceae bacterium]|nr:hypothetical protein [Chitinophagaceae bacterium]